MIDKDRSLKPFLATACRELFNATPSDHLCRIRLAHAARLLRERPGLPVTAVAFEVGFGSSQYFATCFRRHHGVTPSEFRRR